MARREGTINVKLRDGLFVRFSRFVRGRDMTYAEYIERTLALIAALEKANPDLLRAAQLHDPFPELQEELLR